MFLTKLFILLHPLSALRVAFPALVAPAWKITCGNKGAASNGIIPSSFNNGEATDFINEDAMSAIIENARSAIKGGEVLPSCFSLMFYFFSSTIH